MTPRAARRAIAVAVALAAVSAGCGKREAGVGCVCEDASLAVDTELMAFLSAARALHHEANLREDDRDLAGAAAALDRLAALPRPRPLSPPPEASEVVADAYARLAELRARTGEVERARSAVDEGLRLASEPTYFRGHLLELSGVVEETRAAALADAGRPGEAAAARARAITALDEAVRVQRSVIQRSAPAGAPPR